MGGELTTDEKLKSENAHLRERLARLEEKSKDELSRICGAVRDLSKVLDVARKRLVVPKVGEEVEVWGRGMEKNVWVTDVVCVPEDSQGSVQWSSLEGHDFGCVSHGRFRMENEGVTWRRIENATSAFDKVGIELKVPWVVMAALRGACSRDVASLQRECEGLREEVTRLRRLVSTTESQVEREWVSARSSDSTEFALVGAEDWDLTPSHRVSATGSPMVVVARFWSRNYDDAKVVHEAINGWSKSR